MQISFETKPVDVKAHEEFWAMMNKAALKGKLLRQHYDPWEGFVLEASEHRLLLVLKNMAEPALELQVYLGCALVTKDVFLKLAEGICFEVHFNVADGSFMEFRFPFAYSA